MISVVRRKFITSCSSVLTNAPMKDYTNCPNHRMISAFPYKRRLFLNLQVKSTKTLSQQEKLPMTPRLVSRRYSNGRVLLTVCRKG